MLPVEPLRFGGCSGGEIVHQPYSDLLTMAYTVFMAPIMRTRRARVLDRDQDLPLARCAVEQIPPKVTLAMLLFYREISEWRVLLDSGLRPTLASRPSPGGGEFVPCLALTIVDDTIATRSAYSIRASNAFDKPFPRMSKNAQNKS